MHPMFVFGVFVCGVWCDAVFVCVCVGEGMHAVCVWSVQAECVWCVVCECVCVQAVCCVLCVYVCV